MDISYCRKGIERLRVGLTDAIVKVTFNVADKFCLRPIVLKLNDDMIEVISACSLLSVRFFVSDNERW